jgi:flagellin
MSLGNVSANNIGSQQLKSVGITPGAGVKAGIITVNGGGETGTVDVQLADSAKDIAAKFNGVIPGMSASASTEAKFTFDSSKIDSAKPAKFTLTIGGADVDFIGVTSQDDMAEQLKSNAAKLGISVVNDKVNGLSIKSATGENITVKTIDAADLGSAGIMIATKDASGTYGTGTAFAAGVIATGAVSLNSNSGYSLSSPAGTSAMDLFGADSVSSNKTKVSDTNVSSAASAQNAIDVITQAISNIDSQRADLGAVQNRFDSTVANLRSISDNSTAARGVIQDVDFAAETAQLTKQQTLQQASTAILSQANQLPSAVLKLLG